MDSYNKDNTKNFPFWISKNIRNDLKGDSKNVPWEKEVYLQDKLAPQTNSKMEIFQVIGEMFLYNLKLN